MTQDMLAEIRDRKDLSSFTFENNEIRDVKGLCAVFKYLKKLRKTGVSQLQV